MTNDNQIQILSDMLRIRIVEEEIAFEYAKQEMRCPIHLSIGQEGPAAVVGALLTVDDQAVSGHRSHAHYLAKGGNLNRFISELYGREDGCSSGKGGSMHLIDESVGFMGSTAIVGGTVPVGVGLALAKKIQNRSGIVCIFFGDAVLETGVLFESINFSIVQKLPILFFCENNLYSVYTDMKPRQPENRSSSQMIENMGMLSISVDGNDIDLSYEVLSGVISSIRQGHGPCFVELRTYRYREHCGPNFDDHLNYRNEKEIEFWKSRDPITLFTNKLIAEGRLTIDQLNNLKLKIKSEVIQSFAWAKASPFPHPIKAFSDLYSE